MTNKPLFTHLQCVSEYNWSSFKSEAIVVVRQAMNDGLVLYYDDPQSRVSFRIENPEDVFSEDNEGEYIMFNGDVESDNLSGHSFFITRQHFIPNAGCEVFEANPDKPYCVLAVAMIILLYNHCRSDFKISQIDDIKSPVWLDAMSLIVKAYPNHTWFLPGFVDFIPESEKGHEYLTISSLFSELGRDDFYEIIATWKDELKALSSPDIVFF